MDEVKGPVAFGPSVLSGKPFGEAHDIPESSAARMAATSFMLRTLSPQTSRSCAMMSGFPGLDRVLDRTGIAESWAKGIPRRVI